MPHPSKTTVLGVLTILGALLTAAAQYLGSGHLDLTALVAPLTAGFGLIHAQDQR